MMATRSLQTICLFVFSLAIITTTSAEEHNTVVDSAYNVEKTIVHSAVSKGAVCLDGSPPAYHFEPGFGPGKENWLVLISGGAWCKNITDCLDRALNATGSSNVMEPALFRGILSKFKTSNPDFYNWNRVYIRYCDGGGFTGDIEVVDPATNLHFRGARIYKAIMEELLVKGLRHAKEAILAGGSAGGYPAMLYCDRFREALPKAQRVKCLVDAGYFTHVSNKLGQGLNNVFRQVVNLHGSAKNLPKSCTSKMAPELCFFPQNIQEDIKTPLFTMMSAFDNFQLDSSIQNGIGDFIRARNCTESQNQKFRELRSEFLSALPKGDNPKHRGVFIDSFNHHTQLQLWWNPVNATPVNNLTAMKAFADWYFDRKYSYVIDEHELPLPVYLNNVTGILISRG